MESSDSLRILARIKIQTLETSGRVLKLVEKLCCDTVVKTKQMGSQRTLQATRSINSAMSKLSQLPLVPDATRDSDILIPHIIRIWFANDVENHFNDNR
jgi:hypothetical protein